MPPGIHDHALKEKRFSDTVRSLEQTFGVPSTAWCLATTMDPLPELDGVFQLHVTSANCYPQPIPETYTPTVKAAVIAEYGGPSVSTRDHVTPKVCRPGTALAGTSKSKKKCGSRQKKGRNENIKRLSSASMAREEK